MAKSLFNDTIAITDKSDNPIAINKQNIAWQSDIDNKFKNLPADSGKDWTKVQWTDVENEAFIVWMRTAGLPNFRKLYGKLDKDLDAGTYNLIIDNNYDVSSFDGSKHFVLSTTNFLGGQNYFLAVCYIIVGALCIMFGIIFFIAYMGRKSQNTQAAGQNFQQVRNN